MVTTNPKPMLHTQKVKGRNAKPNAIEAHQPKRARKEERSEEVL